jgi:hypothetical protein
MELHRFQTSSNAYVFASYPRKKHFTTIFLWKLGGEHPRELHAAASGRTRTRCVTDRTQLTTRCRVV